MMSRTVFAFAILFFVFLAAIPDAGADTVSYVQVMESSGVPPVTVKVWIKDDRMRMESEAQGEKLITIKRSDGIYNYIPSRDMLTKLPRFGEENNNSPTSENPLNYVEYLRSQDAKFTGNDTINGYECDVYEYVDKYSRAHVIAWIWKEKEFPVQMMIKPPVGYQTLVTFRDIKINGPVSDELFELPKSSSYIDTTNVVDSIKGLLQQYKDQAEE